MFAFLKSVVDFLKFLSGNGLVKLDVNFVTNHGDIFRAF